MSWKIFLTFAKVRFQELFLTCQTNICSSFVEQAPTSPTPFLDSENWMMSPSFCFKMVACPYLCYLSIWPVIRLVTIIICRIGQLAWCSRVETERGEEGWTSRDLVSPQRWVMQTSPRMGSIDLRNRIVICILTHSALEINQKVFWPPDCASDQLQFESPCWCRVGDLAASDMCLTKMHWGFPVASVLKRSDKAVARCVSLLPKSSCLRWDCSSSLRRYQENLQV